MFSHVAYQTKVHIQAHTKNKMYEIARSNTDHWCDMQPDDAGEQDCLRLGRFNSRQLSGEPYLLERFVVEANSQKR